MTSIKELRQQLDLAMQADRFRLSRKLREIEQAQRAGRSFDQKLARTAEELTQSVATCQQRKESVPELTFDDALPISLRREEIATAIREHQVVIVCGETGSGKSTQLPKICLELGRGVRGLIGHTQPRRIAARSVATRIAEELGSPLGRDVSFKVRFTDTTSKQTYIKLMTDGILLAESQNDRFFDAYDTIIIDEAHERSLNIDFLIGYLKQILPRRPDLKVIITSATINAQHFAAHFASEAGPAPVLEVSGRTYPVEVRYRPLETTDPEEEPDLEQAIVRAVDEVSRIDNGDILLFMPTERDILSISKKLRSARNTLRNTEVIPLYARLSVAEQNRVFQPQSKRKLVIATNVAESSLTVPGIRFVIDTGTARISRYSPRSKVQRLPIEDVSRASADQRKGRCGRVGPGICIRLFDEGDFLARDAFTVPEIQRSNLAAVILQIKSLRFGEIEDFPFLDPPKPEAIRDGYRTLFELGAVDEQNQLTRLGRQISQIPSDPRIARIILAAHDQGCLHEILIIAAALEVQDPRERPLERQGSADQAHEKFQDEQSDFLSYLKLWDFYQQLKNDLSHGQLRKACKQNFLSWNRLREWTDVNRQLLQIVEGVGLEQQPRRNDSAAIHRALLTGYLSNIAHRPDTHEYTVAGGGKAHLWPGSGAFASKPKWLIAADVIETSRRYLRTVGRIDPSWIEPLAEHLLKRSYQDMHWDRDAASAMAFEKVLLLGLPIVPRRRIRYGRIDPDKSRELFIEHALVQGAYESQAPFFRHNRDLITEVETLENKARRRDLLQNEDALSDFYTQRIPETVFDGQSFELWRREVEQTQPKLLFMSQAELLGETAEAITAEVYPDQLQVEQASLPLNYRFEPGGEQDGITITVPQETLPQLEPQRLNWLVPGLVEEKITALIKSLPKAIRREFAPAPDSARKVAKLLNYGQGDFLRSVADILTRLSGIRVTPDLFSVESLPDHLRMNIQVVDAQGQTVAVSRDLEQVRQQIIQEVTANPESGPIGQVADENWVRDDITTWDFGELPTSVIVERGGVRFPVYPVLLDTGSTLSLRLINSPDIAEYETRAALRRLFLTATRKQVKSQVDWLPQFEQMKLQASGLSGIQPLKERLAELIAHKALFADAELPRTPEGFQLLCQQARPRLGGAAADVAKVLPLLTQGWQTTRLALEKANQHTYARAAVEDICGQLSHLLATTESVIEPAIAQSFLVTTPWTWLIHIPRYLQAIAARLDRLASGGGPRDAQSQSQLDPHWQNYLARAADHRNRGILDAELIRYRWMIEEFRVSLFAQKLGTAMTISAKRLEEQWQKVRA